MPDEDMNLKIVYLGWGSLIWDYSNLPINAWKQSDLELPLEFSRISDYGQGRMTLVIDQNGTMNKIWYAQSNEKNVNKAIKVLRIREKTVANNIAYLNLYSKQYRFNNTHPKLAKRIANWAHEMRIDVVIWTDLPSNWKTITKSNFSVRNAFQYFKHSQFETQLKIVEYIYRANRNAHITTKFSNYFFNHLLHGSI